MHARLALLLQLDAHIDVLIAALRYQPRPSA